MGSGSSAVCQLTPEEVAAVASSLTQEERQRIQAAVLILEEQRGIQNEGEGGLSLTPLVEAETTEREGRATPPESPRQAEQDKYQWRDKEGQDPWGPSEAASVDANVTQDLGDYFVNLYKQGGIFDHEEYQPVAEGWCWIHESGIKVWQDALDLTGGGGSGEVQCFFHYTSQLGFQNITATQKKAVEVFASLVTEGPGANAWWGAGVYTVRKAPHQWRDAAHIVDNNFRNMHKRDVDLKGKDVADKEYKGRVMHCIPILAHSSIAYDVAERQTPEMLAQGKPPGQNLADKLLNEPGLPERECIVIRVQKEEEVGHANAVLLDTLEMRAGALGQRMGAEDPYALLALNRLQSVLLNRGLFARAEQVNRQMLQIHEAINGPQHLETIFSVNNLATVLQQQGKFSEAEGLLRRAWTAWEGRLGKWNPNTLVSLQNLACNLMEQNKLAEAEELQRRALEGCREVAGESHLHTLSGINVLAMILERQKKLPEAEELQRQVLAVGEKTLGPNHPDTLVWVHNLALNLKQQGQLAQAEPLMRRCLAASEQQLGTEHPDTLSSVLALATLLEEKKDLDEAEALYRQAMERTERSPMNRYTLTVVNRLAVFLRNQGRLAEADPLFQRALEGREATLGSDHLETIQAVNGMGKLRLAQERLEEAEALFRRALTGFESQLGAQHANTLQTVLDLAKVLEAKGFLNEAEELYIRELKAFEEVHGADDPKTAESRQKLQRFREKHGRPAEGPSDR